MFQANEKMKFLRSSKYFDVEIELKSVVSYTPLEVIGNSLVGCCSQEIQIEIYNETNNY